MSKNPSGPTGPRDRSSGGDDPSPVSFFNSKGEEIGRRDPPSAKSATEPDAYLNHNAPEIDDDPVLIERIASQVADVAREHADDLGDMLYSKFMHILTTAIKDTSGQLTAADAEKMGREFKAELAHIKTVFIEAVDAVALSREKSRTEQVRSKIFFRLMVHDFEHRFADEPELDKKPDRLSRRILPGFFSVLLLMFGEQRLANYERDAKKLTENIRRENGGHLDWATVYKAPKLRSLCLRAQIEIAQHFAETEKRLSWMTAVINTHLLPENERKSSRPWELGTTGAEKMLSALFRSLHDALGRDAAREKLAERFGAPTLTVLDKVVGRF